MLYVTTSKHGHRSLTKIGVGGEREGYTREGGCYKGENHSFLPYPLVSKTAFVLHAPYILQAELRQ